MSFGELLRELLDMAGLKQAQLADYLGYDVSYINKWISGQKFPSVRNNHFLFRKIAEFLLSSGGEIFRAAFLSKEQLSPALSTQETADRLCEMLSSSFRQPEPRQPRKRLVENNCRMDFLSSTFTENMAGISGAIIESHSKKAGTAPLEFISIPMLAFCGYSHAKNDWVSIRRQIPTGRDLHVRFAADFSKAEYRLALCHDVLIFLFGLPEGILFDIYSDQQVDEKNQSLFICQNAIFSLSFFDVLRQGISEIHSQEPQMVTSYYSMADKYLHNMTKLIERESFASLYAKKYFQAFFIDPQLFSFHTVMPMLFADGALLEEFLARPGLSGEVSGLCRFYLKNLHSWTAVLYKSVIIKFLFDGLLSVMGQTVTLPPEGRKLYLERLLAGLEETEGLLFILNDVNPVFNRADTDCSLFLNSCSLFAVRQPDGEKARPILVSDDEHLVGAFHAFFEELTALPSNFALSASDAREFLQRCIQMI